MELANEPPAIEPPDGLSPDALDLFEDVVSEHGATIKPASFAALIQACRLITQADAMMEAVGNDYTVTGSSGQQVPNGLLTEIRLARAAAVQALKAAGLSAPTSAASAAGAALVGRRWSKAARSGL